MQLRYIAIILWKSNKGDHAKEPHPVGSRFRSLTPKDPEIWTFDLDYYGLGLKSSNQLSNPLRLKIIIIVHYDLFINLLRVNNDIVFSIF